jgi:WD40 repeat protein
MPKFFFLVTALVSLLVLCPGRGADLPKPAALGERGKLLAEYKFEASESSNAFSRPLSVSLAEDLIIITELGATATLPKPKTLPVQLLRLKLTPKVEVTRGPSLDAPPDYMGNMFRCSAFSPDGKIVAVSSQLVKSAKWDDNWAVIDFYRTGDGVRYKSLHREKGPDFVTGLRFSPNGKSLAVGYSVHNAGREGSFGLWDLGTDTFRQFGRVQPSDICFNDAGTQIASSESYNGIVQIWDVESGKELAKDDPISDAPVGAMGAQRSMRFSQDSKTLFSASVESRPGLRTREYNLTERKKIAAWEMPKKEEEGAKREMLNGCVLSPDGELMLTSEERRRNLRGDECDMTISCELTDLKSRRSFLKIETYSGRVKTAPKREGAFSASASVQTMYLSHDTRFIVTLGGPRDGSDTRLKVWATGLSAR